MGILVARTFLIKLKTFKANFSLNFSLLKNFNQAGAQKCCKTG